MEIDLPNLPPNSRYQFLTSVVLPRPIAWVTSSSPDGVVNAAPFSFFNVFGSKPPLVVLGIGNRPDTGEPKDTVLNIKSSAQFVINTVSFPQTETMVQTSSPLPRDQSEIQACRIRTTPSKRVAPPRIADSPVSLECELHSIQEIGQNRLIVAQVVFAHVDDAYLDSIDGSISPNAMQLVGRMAGSDGYCRAQDLFQVPRPS